MIKRFSFDSPEYLGEAVSWIGLQKELIGIYPDNSEGFPSFGDDYTHNLRVGIVIAN